MDTSLSRGVKLHQPAKATSLITDSKTGSITGVKVLDLKTSAESIISCTNLVICTGPWTSHVFKDLFPASRVSIPVSPLAGYSLVVRSPRYTLEHERETYGGRSHAVFTDHPLSCGFSPEVFSRRGGEIYIAGLNSPQMPLPSLAEDTSKLMDRAEIDRLRAVAVRLMGGLADGCEESTNETANTDDLEILREGLCFRPVSRHGVPIISRIPNNLLGNKTRSSSSERSTEGGVFVATGHGPWGIALSLGTGKVVAEMIQGLKTSADISDLG